LSDDIGALPLIMLLGLENFSPSDTDTQRTGIA